METSPLFLQKNVSFPDQVGFLQEENTQLKEENSDLTEQLSHHRDEIKRLNHIVFLLKKSVYGPKSEPYIDSENPQLTFNDLEEDHSCGEPAVEKEAISYDRKKGRGKKRPFPDHLPREEVIIDIPEDMKVCPHDGTTLKPIGEEVVEKLKTVPAQSTVVVERKLKYACPCCESHVVGARSESILPQTTATPELLSFLIFSKFFQSLPLYRLEELYKLQGIFLTRGTMARWLVQVSEHLMPLWNLLEERVVESGYMAIDGTPVQVLKEPGRRAQDKSVMWARGSPEQNIVLFDYDVSGGGRVAERLIGDFQGAVQADAHKGYRILDRERVTLLGCLMHARRRFHKAWESGGKKPGVAQTGLKMIRRIYKFEKSYKEQALTPQQRYEARHKEVKPYIENMKKWCEKKKPKVLQGSPLGNAIHYFLNEYEELSGFLKNGRYEVDNSFIERVIRKFAIGRNNWIFSTAVEGARASSLLYSLALTAKLNGKDPFIVMTEILKKLPKAQSLQDYEALTELLLDKKNIQGPHS